MSDTPTTYQRLAVPFDLEDHSKVSKGSGSQTYAPWTSYVGRLNAELQEHWSFRVVREGFTETECWVLGEITATIDGTVATRQQYGCEPIALGQKPNGDLLKKAATDAIKKAASLLGVGLYLSDKEEREAIEAEMRAAVQAETQRQVDERKAEAAAKLAGRANPTPTPINDGATPDPLQQRWQRLVAEAERVKLPTLGRVKAIDPRAVGAAQLKSHADLLEQRIYEAKEAAGAA